MKLEALRVLWLNWRDIRNPDAGGAEVFTREVAKRLVERGWGVTLSAYRCRSARGRFLACLSHYIDGNAA